MSSATPSQTPEDRGSMTSMAVDLATAIMNSSNHAVYMAQESLQATTGVDLAMAIIHSSNHATAVAREVLQGMLTTATMAHPPEPIMVHYGKGETNGLTALVYMKNKLDMGNVVVSLEGLFIGKEDEFVEVDIDSWEEVFPRIVRLRLRVK